MNISMPGETISSKRYESRVGGKGANQAVAIARAGGTIEFCGTVGKDGEWIVEYMKKHGIDISGIIVSEDETTGRAIIQVSDDGENSIILFPGANHSELHEKRIALSCQLWFPEATHLLLQNEINYQSTLTSLFKAKEEGLCTIFNPSPMLSPAQIHAFLWDKVDWLLVNEGEAEALYRGSCTGSQDSTALRDSQNFSTTSVKDGIASLLASLDAFKNTNIICTLGADGVLAYLRRSDGNGSASVYRPAARLQGIFRDTTGAGDCFTGYFVSGLMKYPPDARLGGDVSEEDIARILEVSNQAAGMSVERPGTIDSIPTRDEVEQRINQAAK
ncbi:hypothetical protein EST38_g10822 [Candolleomyces aberdarensis]|uniref:Carbohydrate kinase PfkB domain-containing protein n=1 Tax=Candolleomyces aberdarensis TaxID=2316362 RepID=A0A4Q2D6G3_9AGAR|nr:hypothetical protein EST38_g10822 [Candolleomyces aberdarensis]